MNNKTLWQNFKKNLALLNKDNFAEFQEIVGHIIQNLKSDELRYEQIPYLHQQIHDFQVYFLNWDSSWELFVKEYKDSDSFKVFMNNGNLLFGIQEEKIIINGFTCIFADANENQIKDAYAKIKKALDLIILASKEHFPFFFKYKVPLYFSFDKSVFCPRAEQTHSTLTYYIEGCYLHKRKIIEINYRESKSAKDISGTIAHELGHHIFQNYLSDKAKQFWYDVVNGLILNKTIRQVFNGSDDYVTEIKKVYKTPKTLGNYQILRDKQLFIKRLEEDLDIDLSRMTKEQLQFIIDQNLDTLVRTYKNPITEYADSSPEEAFCEFLMILVKDRLFMIDRSWRNYFETAMGMKIQNKLAKSIHTYKF